MNLLWKPLRVLEITPVSFFLFFFFPLDTFSAPSINHSEKISASQNLENRIFILGTIRDPENKAPEIDFERTIISTNTSSNTSPNTLGNTLGKTSAKSSSESSLDSSTTGSSEISELLITTFYRDRKTKTVLASESGKYQLTREGKWKILEYSQKKDQESEICEVRQIPSTGDPRTNIYQYKRADRKGQKIREEKINHWALTPDLLLFHLRDHLEKLKTKQDTLPLKLIVPCRQETYGFSFSLISRNADEIRVKLIASHFLLAVLAPQFEFVLNAKVPTRLLRYTGRVLPLRKSGTQFEEYDGILEITEVTQSKKAP